MTRTVRLLKRVGGVLAVAGDGFVFAVMAVLLLVPALLVLPFYPLGLWLNRKVDDELPSDKP